MSVYTYTLSKHMCLIVVRCMCQQVCDVRVHVCKFTHTYVNTDVFVC